MQDSRFETYIRSVRTFQPPETAVITVARHLAEKGCTEKQIIEIIGEEFIGNTHIKPIAKNAIKQWGKEGTDASPTRAAKPNVRGRRSVRKTR